MRRAQQPAVIAAQADELRADRHAVCPCSSGSDTAGVPSSVQIVQKTGLPVAVPSGASPVAAGVRIAS